MRTLNSRHLALAGLLLASRATSAQAQDVVAIVVGVIGGFTALSATSIWKLSDFGRSAGVGDSLRIRRRGSTQNLQYVGRVVAITDDSMSVRVGDSLTTFARADVSRVRAYSGLDAKWAEGWAIGFAAGAIVGVAQGYSTGGSPPGCEVFCANRDQTALAAGVLGGITGSALGAGIGAFVRLPHWRRVKRLVASSEAARVSVAPMIGRQTGIRLGVTF